MESQAKIISDLNAKILLLERENQKMREALSREWPKSEAYEIVNEFNRQTLSVLTKSKGGV